MDLAMTINRKLPMKLTKSCLAFALVLALASQHIVSAQPATPAAPPGAPVNGPAGPQIQFATPIYDFGKASAGELVKYQFVFTNAGNEVLAVSNVQPSCGCTTAGEWTRRVEPGNTGIIPIQFNSSAYNGPVTKTVTVTSNDKTHPTFALQIKGTVWKAIEISPQNAVLNIAAESPSNATSVVKIISHLDQPITLSEPECNNHTFAAEIKTIQPGKEFELIVKTVPPFGQGNVQGMITMKTSATNMPTINVMAIAMIQQAVVVSPPQVYLSAAPLGGAMSTTVTIRNNGTNSLSVSDAAVNATGVDVQVKETEPGRQFNVTLLFPAGFETGGPNVALTFKTSHPKFPVITVPIRQQIRPLNMAARGLPKPLLPATNRPALVPIQPPPVPQPAPPPAH
jgi:hypothetical protein